MWIVSIVPEKCYLNIMNNLFIIFFYDWIESEAHQQNMPWKLSGAPTGTCHRSLSQLMIFLLYFKLIDSEKSNQTE